MSSSQIIAIVRVRMDSSRLPGKALLPLVGQPLLARLLERLGRAHQLNGIIVATTTNQEDDAIEALTRALGVPCFRGSEYDVLGRVLAAAVDARADAIVEITGDCPLIDPDVVDRVVEAFLSEGCDYASNILKRTYPRGLDTQVFWTRVLQEVDTLTSDPADREHVSLYIYEHPERFRLLNVESELDERYWDWRLTVDTLADYRLIDAIFARLYPFNHHFALADVLGLLDQEPALLTLNRDIPQKAPR